MAAISGVGTVLKKWATAAWGAIAQITSITGPNLSKETIDVTSLDSTGGFREFISSFKDSGTLNLSMNFTKEGFDSMKTDFESNVPVWYQISLPDGTAGALATSLMFQGIVTELPLSITTDSQITMDVVIKITGGVTVLAAPQTTTPTT